MSIALDTLHSRMLTGDQRGLVVTGGHALLEGSSVNAGDEHGTEFAYCLVYDLGDSSIAAMRCYGSLARLMSAEDQS